MAQTGDYINHIDKWFDDKMNQKENEETNEV